MDQRAQVQVERPAAREDVLRLVYAGSPGKKDLLGNAIRGLGELRSSSVRVSLRLVGPSRRVTADCLGPDARLLDGLDDMIEYHGRVPHDEAVRLVAGADFSILLRPDKRYAHAGFPTKLVESLSLGVPIITNPTSDIAEYVRDGKEGMLLEDISPKAFAAAVRRVLEMPSAQRAAMKGHASQRARECFDYRRYVEPLKAFVQDVDASGPGGN
jgi:glycosyltransferase involved in cell wall biosynthesis